jgi:hypothetical protein
MERNRTSRWNHGPRMESLEPRLLLSAVAGVTAALQGCSEAPTAPVVRSQSTVATHSFTTTDEGTHPQSVIRWGDTLRLDFTGLLPAGTTVHRAILVHDKGSAKWRDKPLRVISTDAPAEPLQTLAPDHVYFDVSDAVRRAVPSEGQVLEIRFESFTDYLGEFRIDVTCDQPLGTQADPHPLVTDLTVEHRDGDTMLTWDSPLDLLMDPDATVEDYKAARDLANGAGDAPQLRYRIYRSDQPITAQTIGQAELVDELDPLSNWYPEYYGATWGSKLTAEVPRLPVGDGMIADVDQAIWVDRTHEAGPSYYAVSVVVEGEENLSAWTPGENTSAEAVDEQPGGGMTLLMKRTEHGPEESWQYVYGATVHEYIRWEPFPADGRSSVPMNYLVAVPPEQYAPASGAHPVDIALHCWGGKAGGGWGWWYEYDRGSLLVGTNQVPYDWWSAHHANYGTILPWTDVEGNPGGVVDNFQQQRILHFLDTFVAENWTVDPQRIFAAGSSMGGGGAVNWALRNPDRFAYANGWVGVYIPELSPQFAGSFENVYGEVEWEIEYAGTGQAAFDYWNSAQYVLSDPGRDAPYLCFGNGKNDGGIGWEQAHRFVEALIQARQPFKFTWGQAGHGQRSILPGEQASDRHIGIDLAADATLPAFTNCSQDDDLGDGSKDNGDEAGHINRYLLWNPDSAVDADDAWAMELYLIDKSPDAQCTVDVTPRRTNAFNPNPGMQVAWRNIDLATGQVVQSGTATVDPWGLVTLPQVIVSKTRNRLELSTLSASLEALDLLAGSDTGRFDDDNVTQFNNDEAGGELHFLVSGAVPGATVELRAGQTVIGSDVASGDTVLVTTDGTTALPDGPHAITAVQIEPGKMPSTPTETLSLTVDTAAPNVDAWYSLATHGNLGTGPLEVTADGAFVESRSSGFRQLRLAFSEAVDPGCFTAGSLMLSGYDADAQRINFTGLDIQAQLDPDGLAGDMVFSDALPNQARFGFWLNNLTDLAGNSPTQSPSRFLTALAGDTNGDQRVSVLDTIPIRANMTAEVNLSDPAETRCDLNNDGRVSVLDVINIRAHIYQTTEHLADPPRPIEPIDQTLVLETLDLSASSPGAKGMILTARSASNPQPGEPLLRADTRPAPLGPSPISVQHRPSPLSSAGDAETDCFSQIKPIIGITVPKIAFGAFDTPPVTRPEPQRLLAAPPASLTWSTSEQGALAPPAETERTNPFDPADPMRKEFAKLPA